MGLSNARIAGGHAEAEISNALRNKLNLSEYPDYFRETLSATDGIRFIFDDQGEYLVEVNAWQLKKAVSSPSFATRMTRSSALMAVLRWYDDNDLRWQDCNELAHISLCRLHYRGAEERIPGKKRKARVKKTTWNQWMVHWCQFLKHAQKERWVEDVGFDLSDARERGKSDPIIPILLPEEMKLVDGCAPSQRFRAGVHSLVGTGMRVAEMAALPKNAVPSPGEFLGEAYRPRTIIGKGLKEREIFWPLRAAKSVSFYVKVERALAVDELRRRVIADEVAVTKTYLKWVWNERTRQRELIEKEDAPLWLAENGDALSPKRWSKEFSALPRSNGRRVTPHWLRHTYAVVTLSMLIKQQIREEVIASNLGTSKQLEYFRDPVDEVRKRLGHASIKTTMVYLDHVAEHRHLLALAIADLENMYLPA